MARSVKQKADTVEKTKRTSRAAQKTKNAESDMISSRKAKENTEIQKAESAEQTKPKKRGSKSASITANLKNIEKGDISRIVLESYQYFDRKPPKDNEELAQRLNDYFRQCTEEDQIPTIEDMALALGVVRQTLYEWESQRRVTNPERSDMIKKAKEILAGIDGKLASEGKIPQVVYIFRAKNFHAMTDQQEVILTPNTPLGDEQNAESLKQKYLDDTYGEQKVIDIEQKENK
ncbi:MAG: hypothetical protein IJ740_18875 [Ruminococcus sp.]|nr:hypothetical protein [Ruminococcus sp.]MBR1752906.1 hypothetical protein [Ruminococcus sp.]